MLQIHMLNTFLLVEVYSHLIQGFFVKIHRGLFFSNITGAFFFFVILPLENNYTLASKQCLQASCIRNPANWGTPLVHRNIYKGSLYVFLYTTLSRPTH